MAEHLAQSFLPDEAADVFYGGLLQGVGAVGACRHITEYNSLQKQLDDPIIRSHSRRGAALLDWFPGMVKAAKLVRAHHEWLDGRGYPDGMVATEIPIGSQILLIAETLASAGCFTSNAALVEGIRQSAIFTGHAWSKQIWDALVKSTEDTAFYEAVVDRNRLQGMIADRLAAHPLSHDMNTEEGVERAFHVFPALVDAKDPSTTGHSLRTARLAKGLAAYMKLPETEVRKTYWAGLVHDCGRLGIPTMILKRSGRLNEEEMNLVRKHPRMTMRILSCMPECPDMAVIGEIAGHDHERYDGGGYPDRLAAESIPFISRIISVADAFDAMTSPTSYKHLLSARFAVIRLKQAAGSQFDPNVVDAMISAVEKGELGAELSRAA